MEGNQEKHLSDIKLFVKSAQRLGCYTTAQAANLGGVLAVLEKQPGISEMTVGDLQEKLDEVLSLYAANSRASHDSVSTYKTRATRLMEDFIKWNGGDIAAWKAEIARNNNGAPSRTKARSRARRVVEQLSGVDGHEAQQQHSIRLSGGRSGELTLPANLAATDIEAVWKQLTALKGLVEAQAEAVAAEDEG